PPAVPVAASRRWWVIGGGAFVVAAVLIVANGLSFDRTETPAVPGPTETGPTQTGLSVAPDPNAEGINGLPPEGATPSAPERGELVVALTSGTIPGGSHDRVWVYADGRVISRVYLPALEPYSGLVEQHLTPEGVDSLRSSVLSTGLFEHDLDLVREDTSCAVSRSRCVTATVSSASPWARAMSCRTGKLRKRRRSRRRPSSRLKRCSAAQSRGPQAYGRTGRSGRTFQPATRLLPLGSAVSRPCPPTRTGARPSS